MKAYVSSTSMDLKPYREAVYDQLRKLRIDVIAMEDYSAGEQRPVDECKADVAGCDVYIGIFAWRYGFIPQESNPHGLSITELEYRTAGDHGKDRLVFLLKDDAAWIPKFGDSHTGEGDSGLQIRRFRNELVNRHNVGFFSTPDELASGVSAAVVKLPAFLGQQRRELTARRAASQRQRSTGVSEQPLRRTPPRLSRTDDDGLGPLGLGAVDLAGNVEQVDWFDERETVRAALEQARGADPALADSIELCAIPRGFDATLLGVLRGQPEAASNDRLIRSLAECTFVFPNRFGGYHYAQSARKFLIDRWREAAMSQAFATHNRRMAEFYWSRFDEEQAREDVNAAALLVPAAFAARPLAPHGLAVVPLRDALEHVTNISAEATFEFVEQRFNAYFDEDRFAACEAVLGAARESLGRLAGQVDRELDAKLQLCEARLFRRLRWYDRSEALLHDLAESQQLSDRFKLEVLGELGDLFTERAQVGRALDVYQQRTTLVHAIDAGPFDVAVAHLSLGTVFSTLGELARAVDELNQAVKGAEGLQLEIWARMALSFALRERGQWDDAWSTALAALDLARTLHRSRPAVHRAVSEGLMSLLASRGPAFVDACFAEATALLSARTPRETLDLRRTYVEALQAGGQLARAAEQLRALFADANQHPDPRFRTRLILLTSSLRTDERRVEEGIDMYREVLRHELQDEEYAGDRAVALLNRANTLAERLRFTQVASDAVTARWKQVGTDASEAQQILSRLGWQKLAALANAVRTRAEGMENPREAAFALEKIRPDLSGAPEYLAEYCLARGDLEAREQQWAAAAGSYHHAARIFSSIERPIAAVQSQEIAAVMAGKNDVGGTAAQYRADARRRRRELAEIERYRPSQAAAKADRANASGLEQLSSALDSGTDRLRAARDAFRSACAWPTTIRFYYALNLAYACAALEDWAEAADALELSLHDGPDWWRARHLEDRARDFRARHLDSLEASGHRALKENRPADAAASFAAARQIARQHLPGTDREATAAGRVALAALEGDDVEAAVPALQDALALYQRRFGADASLSLGRAWSGHVTTAGRYRSLDARLNAIAAAPGTTPDMRREVTRLRQGLSSDLDRVCGAEAPAPAAAIPAVTPIVLELARGLIPADSNAETWPLFTRHIPAFLERIDRELGIEVPGVRVRPNDALVRGQYTVFINEARVVTGETRIGSRYCVVPESTLDAVDAAAGAVRAIHPGTRQAGFWIPAEHCERLERAAGCICAEPTDFIVQHVEAVVRANLGEIVSLSDVETLVTRWSEGTPSIRAQFDEPGDIARLAAVVRALLDERVPVLAGPDIGDVLRTLPAAEIPALVREVRLRIKDVLPGNVGPVHREVLPEAWEQTLSTGLREGDQTVSSDVWPADANATLVQIRRWLNALPSGATAIVRNPLFRVVLRRLIKAEFPDVCVLAEEEVVPAPAAGEAMGPSTEDRRAIN